MNLVAAGAVVWIGAGPLGLNATAMGFGAGWGTDALLGAALGAGFAVPVLVAAFIPRTRKLVADARIRGLSPSALALRALVRVPVGTALLEEVAFRGVLYGAWRSHGVVPALIGTAVPFGLWHISPTINLMEANSPRAGRVVVVRAVLGGVALTTAAGVGFAALRASLGSSGGPFGLHAALNGLATVAAGVAARRVQAQASSTG